MEEIFGWCIDHHNCSDCRLVYRDWNNEVHYCICECHEGVEMPEPPEELKDPKPPVKRYVRRSS